MKKGVILYRVSTDQQDYEMQVRKNREFCKEQNIEIIDEYREHDVSGYKTQLKDRKELLKILTRAEEKGDFDCLIIYNFDRIIRREDEAPFVLSVLARYNIECIEATTGETLKNEDMSDKLMNYIRFWQAETESAKTAQRVSDAIENKNKKGEYAGGRPAFGYELYLTDKLGNKGRQLKDLRINEDEAEIIREIFDMYVNKKMGTLSIAEELNTNPKYKGRNRPKRRRNKETNEMENIPVIFRQSSLPRMLRNTIYIGRIRYNTVETTRDKSIVLPQDEWKMQDYREDLRIIDDDIFLKAQEILLQNRIVPNEEKVGITKSGVLCSGIAYCECGAKLFSSFSRYKYTRKDGSVSDYGRIYRYVCREGREINKLHKEKYGKTYYAAKKYDKFIEKTIVEYLDSMNLDKLKCEIDKNKANGIDDMQKSIEGLRKEKEQCYKNINSFEKKLDDDVENMDIYIKGIRRNENRAKEIEKEIDRLQEQIESNKKDNYDYEFIYNNFQEYYNDFLSDNIDKKRLVLDALVDKIIFRSDGVDIVLKTAIEKSLINNDDYITMSLPLHSGKNRMLKAQQIIDVIKANFIKGA